MTVAGLLVVLAAAVRMPFWLSHTHVYGNGDAAIWQVWSRAIHEHGFINVLRTADSNNVGYHYVLWPISAIYGAIDGEYELWTPLLRIMMKVPPFMCDLALAALIFYVARGLVRSGDEARRNLLAAGASAAFVLAPATIYDSMWWTQIDSVITLCMLGAAVLLARGHVMAAWALLTVGFLFKPQPIVVVPVLAAFTYWRFGLVASARGVAAVALTALAALAPFLLHGDAVRIVEAYDRMFEQWPLDLSQGAWNGWSILDARGDPGPSDIALSLGGFDVSYAVLSLGLCVLATLVALAYLRRHLDLTGLLLASAAMVFAFYMLPTSTHERYLYPAFALAAPLLVRAPGWFVAGYALLSTTFFLNLLAINPPSASEFWQWQGTDFAVAIAALHVAVYVVFVAAMLARSVRLPAVRTRALRIPARATMRYRSAEAE